MNYLNRAFQPPSNQQQDSNENLRNLRRKAHDAINKCKDADVLDKTVKDLKKKVKLD